jgi:hypothetical protein
LTTAVGEVKFTRRYWQCTCSEEGGYAADALLGIQGQRSTKVVQKHCCKLASDLSFAGTSETMEEMLGVQLCPETVRKMVEGHGKQMARFQAKDTVSEKAFQEAAGEVEFATDAGKVHTREEGWKDLKIAVVSKREAGPSMTPESWRSQRLPAATIVLAFAMIATAKEFRKQWRPRLRRLGVRCFAGVQALADGASWIWKAVGRCLTGCIQTLDFFHACQHLHRGAERIYGEGTPEAKSAYRRGRTLLVQQGWQGVCQWVSELYSGTDETEREKRRPHIERMLGYFAKHTQRLNYAERLSVGRAIGSGQVEGKAKTLGLRLKLRGARWNRVNVQPMASLICVRHSSHQWDAYWNLALAA